MHTPEVDPDLEIQLENAKDDEQVEAVLLLRRASDEEPSAAEADILLERVRDEVDDTTEVNYIPRVGVLVIRARSTIIRRLINQPEVEMATANRIGDDEL